MKKFITSYIILICLTFSIVGCNELDDIGPVGRLAEDETIINLESAENVLNGVYNRLRGFGFQFYSIEMFNKMGLTSGVPAWGSPDQFHLNIPHPGLIELTEYYTDLYRLVQEANLFIENINNVDSSILGGEAIKNSLIGEARFLRGLAYFYILRSYGEHFDTSSQYGATIRDTPARDTTVIPRSSVEATYAFITTDFQFAIDNIDPSLNLNWKANLYAAKAMLAKTKLYEGDYTTASTLAAEVIADSGGRVFADPYANNFAELNVRLTVDSPELLFAPFYNGTTQQTTSIPDQGYFDALYPIYGSGDPRFGTSKGSAFSFENGFEVNGASHIHIRLSEVYLIHAEAEARAGSGVDAEALASLNTVRTRTAVGLPIAAPADRAELLEAIRLEKLLELYGENGEEFFDLVRYAELDGLDPSTIKPEMNNPTYYILPIPNIERQAPGGEIVDQNPGY